jgi:branched-chain amino acid transport system permease protein
LHDLLQQLVNGLSLGAIYALIALGYTMVYGIIELINFAHGDVYTLGTFFSLSILALLGSQISCTARRCLLTSQSLSSARWFSAA